MPDINLTTGIVTNGQFPLDSKRYVRTLAELSDLGVNNFRAFIYYDRLKVLCLEDNKEYVWREEETIGEADGVVLTSYTYPANTISNGIDYSGKTFNFFEFSSSSGETAVPVVENFGAIWTGTGLTFDCYANPYIISNQVYSTSPAEVTLPVAPSTIGDKRKDAIVVDVDGVFSVVSSPESPDPIDPDIDETTQRLITVVLLSDNVVTPDGFSQVQVYDENVGEPNEFLASTNVPLEIDLGSTDNPNQNTIHIRGINVNDGAVITLTKSTYQSFLAMNAISLAVETDTEAAAISIRFKKDSVYVTNGVFILPGVYGYQGVQAGYQNIGLPMGAYNFSDEEFNEIEITFKGYTNANLGNIDIDNIRILYGGDPFGGGNNTFLGLFDVQDTSYFFKEGYAPLVGPFEDRLVLTRIPLFTDIYRGNALINGGVDFVLGLERRLWATEYIIDNQYYFGLVEQNATHDSNLLEANPRWDIYFLEKLSSTSPTTFGIIKGVNSADPEKPELTNPTKQVKIGEKIFLANEPDTPPEVIEELIYDENLGEPTEWTLAPDPNVSGSANLGSGPYQGAVHISVNNTSVAGNPSSITVILDNDVLTTWDAINGALSFALRFNGVLTNQARVRFQYIDNVNGVLTTVNSFDRNALEQRGLNNSLPQNWYLMSFPSSDFEFNSSEFDRLAITFEDCPRASLDYIRYTGGVVSTPTETNVTEVSVRNENDVEQFLMTDRILFEGFTFDQVLKKVIAFQKPLFGNVLFVNSTLGSDTVRPLISHDVYQTLEAAIDLLFADVSRGENWIIHITDSGNYTLTTNYDADDNISRWLDIRSDFQPVVTQESAIRLYAGDFKVDFKKRGRGDDFDSLNSSEWNFVFTDNDTDFSQKLSQDDNDYSKELRFNVDKSTVTENGGLAYTPDIVFVGQRTSSIDINIGWVIHNGASTYFGAEGAWGGENVPNFIEIKRYDDYTTKANVGFDGFTAETTTIKIDLYQNLSGMNKQMKSDTGIPDDASTNYILKDIVSPTHYVSIEGNAQSQNLLITLMGGVMENTYFNSGHPTVNYTEIQGIKSKTLTVLNYTIPTHTTPFILAGRLNTTDEDVREQFPVYVRDCIFRVTGGVNVGHAIVDMWTNDQALDLNTRVLWDNSCVELVDDVDADIFKLGYNQNIYSQLTIMGACYFRWNTGRYLINYDTAGTDPSGADIVDLLGMIKCLGVGATEENWVNDSRVELTNAHFNKRPDPLGFSVSDEELDLEVGVQSLTYRAPYNGILKSLFLTVNDGPFGSTIICDVLKNGVSILGTLISIDPDTKATGTVTLDTGASGSVDGITVDGVQIMSGAESFDTDLDTTATNVAANITAYSSAPNYVANAVGAVITITPDQAGDSTNGFVVVSTATTITTTDVNLSGGTTEENSDDATTPVVISDNVINFKDEIAVVINQVGSISPGRGLKCWLNMQPKN